MRQTMLTATAFVLVTAGPALAQTERSAAFRRELSATGVLMRPRGDFQRLLPFAGGPGVHYLRSIRSSAVAVGGEWQALFYSYDRQYANTEMVASIHGMLRLRGGSGSRRPFAEAIAGLKQFSTDNRFGTSSYGVGGGIQFRLRAGQDPGEQELLEIGARYMRGGEARPDYGRSVSSTGSLQIRVGMALEF